MEDPLIVELVAIMEWVPLNQQEEIEEVEMQEDICMDEVELDVHQLPKMEML